jgi:hypothetical protein
MKAPTHKADASARLSDEFPAGYSSTRCSPAVLVSASPAGVDDASGLFQLRGIFNNERSRTEKPEPIHRQRSTLTGQFFCPKNGEYLNKTLPRCRGVSIANLDYDRFQLSGPITFGRTLSPQTKLVLINVPSRPHYRVSLTAESVDESSRAEL